MLKKVLDTGRTSVVICDIVNGALGGRFLHD